MESLAAVARLAAQSADIRHRLESAAKDALRLVLAESRLVYLDGEDLSIVQKAMDIASSVAVKGGTKAEILEAVEEVFHEYKSDRLKQLTQSSSQD